jgi:hypothetical protein
MVPSGATATSRWGDPGFVLAPDRHRACIRIHVEMPVPSRVDAAPHVVAAGIELVQRDAGLGSARRLPAVNDVIARCERNPHGGGVGISKGPKLGARVVVLANHALFVVGAGDCNVAISVDGNIPAAMRGVVHPKVANPQQRARRLRAARSITARALRVTPQHHHRSEQAAQPPQTSAGHGGSVPRRDGAIGSL